MMSLFPDPLDDPVFETLSIDLNDIKEIFMILTDDQRNIVMHIYYMYKNKIKISEPDENGEIREYNPRIILQGPAGTGKSTVINFIEKLITWEENKTTDAPQNLKVLKCAFTGKAASNIDGLTLHHTFSIPLYKRASNLSKKRLETKKSLLKNCIFFICDEISMVGTRTMSTVNQRLQQIFNNTELYGDRFVLLVGDLYQIDPVNQKPVYPNSEFWTCCQFYELTKIIRQEDEKFINALNHFRNSQMTEEDIELLMSRKVQAEDVPASAIHLFFLNRHVDQRNTERIDESSEEEKVVNTIDEEWQPDNLRVKKGVRYMITYNVDVGDGLANGTTGVVRGFDCNGDDVRVIWMEFHSNSIGRKVKAEYFAKHDRPGFENWVPIQRSKVVAKLKSDPKVNRTFGNMFPLKAAEAITVHKSQGQTYHGGVCVNITDDPHDRLRTDKSLQYVALTRVKRLEDLYIVGDLKLSSKNTKKFIHKENEITRLRTDMKLKLAYETFEGIQGDVIVYLNSGSTFDKYYQFVTTDKWYRNASLLIVAETNTIASDNIEMPTFEMAWRSDEETALRSTRGILCYKKPNKTVTMVSSMTDDENKIYLSLLLYENYLYIITGVKGDLSDEDFTGAINLFISKYVQESRCLVLIGDIDPDSPSLTEFFTKNNFIMKLSCEVSLPEENTARDMVLTRDLNIHQGRFGYYEYIPSCHKAMYVELPSRSGSCSSGGIADQPGSPGTSTQDSEDTLENSMETD